MLKKNENLVDAPGVEINTYQFPKPVSIQCFTDSMECSIENLDTHKEILKLKLDQLTISPSAIMYDEGIAREFYDDEYDEAHDVFLSRKKGGKFNFYVDLVAKTTCEKDAGDMRCFFGKGE